jgi:mannosyltransferase
MRNAGGPDVSGKRTKLVSDRDSPVEPAREVRWDAPAGTVGYGVGVALCLLAGVLGGLRLGSKGLWHDEAFSDAVARLDPSTIWRVITHKDTFNGLYYGLLHLWTRWGDGEAWLRLPSVAFGIGAVYVLFVLNRRLFGSPTAVFASILLAINPFFVRYLQEARAYTLAVFLVVLATYLFVRALEYPSLPRWIAYGGVCTLAIWAHVFSAWVVLAHFLSLPLRRSRPRLGHLAAGYGATAILVAPLVVLIVLTDPLQRPFIERPTLRSFETLFLELTGGSDTSGAIGKLLLIAFFLASCVALAFAARVVMDPRQGPRSPEAWRIVLVLLWLGVPILGTFAASIMWTPSFLPRYLIVALPALATIAALGVSRLNPRALRAAAMVVLVALSIPPLVSYYGADIKEEGDWRGAVAYVVRAEHPGDGVVFLSKFGRLPFEYYLRRLDDGSGLTPVYPGMPWGRYTPTLADLDNRSTAAAATRLENGPLRVWVVSLWGGLRETDHQDPRPLEAVLTREFEQEARRVFGSRLEVRLYVRA